MDERLWEPTFPSDSERILLACAEKTYAVPRQFGIGTALLVTTLFGIFFGVMTALRAPSVVIVFCSSFLVWVALAQMALPRAPRLGSILAGAVFLPATAGLALIARDGTSAIRLLDWLVGGFWLGLVGSGVGYVVGTLLAGVFLIAENVVQLLLRRRPEPLLAGSQSHVQTDP